MIPQKAPAVHPVPLAEVSVDQSSVFAPARDRMLHLARRYPADRLLAVFRANAGLDTFGAQPPGGWEDHGHPNEEPWSERDYPGRGEAQTANLLRGHYAGHFLSMLSLACSDTGDHELKQKAEAVVVGLGEVQCALAATGRFSHPGFLAAYGEWQFSRLEVYAPYGEIWAPYYTTHKIMAGLLDAHELVGSSQALQIVTQMGRWVHARLEKLEPERLQAMWSLYIAGEFGGMNETLARLAKITGDGSFLTTAQFFDQESVLEAGSAGVDILDGMHANQHVPQLIGYVHEYELTGDRRYLEAAAGIFDAVVPGRMFAHGGTGESELWGPANTVAGEIGARNAETCVVYNLLKLARLLFGHTEDPKYMDYCERGMLNQILGSKKAQSSDTSPEVAYMFPVHPGARREFDNTGTCCGGTGLENHVRHQEGQFFRAPGQLWVNQLFPAMVDRNAEDEDAPEGGAGSGRLNLRVGGGYPLSTSTSIRWEAPPGASVGTESVALHLRIPGWVQGMVGVLINGVPLPDDHPPVSTSRAGAYITVHREWSAGDEVTLHLPVRLRAVPTVDDGSVHSLELGPTVLMARSEQTEMLRLSPSVLAGDSSSQSEAPDPDGGVCVSADTGQLLDELHRRGAISWAGLEWEPAFSGSTTQYHMYFRFQEAGSSAIGFDIDPGPTGWYTAAPTVRVDAAAVVRESEGHEPEASGECREAGGLMNAEVQVDGGGWWAYEGPFPLESKSAEAEGVHAVRVRVSDASGQLRGRAEAELKVDVDPPVTTATVTRLGSAVEIAFTAEDAVSGVQRIQWEGPGTFWATYQQSFVWALNEQEQVIEYAATDGAGNIEPRRCLVLPARGDGPSS